ncbi:MAG: ammonia-forming cytochrome c nitrite reductase subunit c552 [Thermoplasmata archaeon]
MIVSILFLAFLFAMLLVMLTVEVNSGDTNTGTRGSGDYQGATSCSGAFCHDSIFTKWNDTAHASAWETLQNSGMAQDYCEKCHVTGAGDAENNGFNVTTNEPSFLVNVQCESCHGPDPMTDPLRSSTRKNFSAEVCATCHGTEHHPYFIEWNESGHSKSLLAAGGQVVDDPECQGCHVAQIIIYETFEGGSIPRPIERPQPVVCAVCHNPHGSPYEHQLRKPKEDLCNTCHTPGEVFPGEVLRHPQSSMRLGISGIDQSEVPKFVFMEDALCSDCHIYSTGPPQNVTGHTFRPSVEACVSCHEDDPRTFPITADQASSAISAWQRGTIDTLFSTGSNISEAQARIERASLYHFSSEVLASAQALFDDANYSMSFVVADRSYGVHNPQYALALLSFANESANKVIDMLTPGTVVGRILDQDGNPMRGARIESLGEHLAVAQEDGNFSFALAPGNYTLEVYKDGSRAATIEDVEVLRGQTTDLGEVSATLPQGGIDLIILAIIIVLALALVVTIGYSLKMRDSRDKE